MNPQLWWQTFIAQTKQRLGAVPPAPTTGLYTYPVALDGGRRYLHLRIAPDGAGVLFVDVTDVIHLNATAAEMAKLALDGVSASQAEFALLRRFRGVTRVQLQAELADVYAMVAQLRDTRGCPTCAISTQVKYAPVFSTAVSAPFKADVALTYNCNNACPHCYNEPERFSMVALSTTDWFRVLDKLADIGIPHIIFTGGEPTLRPDLPDLIRYADRLGLIVGMNTNGRRLGTMPLLAEAGLNHIQITLNSCYADVHNAMVAADAFDETVPGIRNALDSGIHTITNTTLTRRNQAHAVDIVKFVHGLGLRTFAMNGMIYAGGGVAEPDAIPSENLPALLAAVRDQADELGMRFLWYTVTDYCRFSPLDLDLAPKRCNAAEYSICIEPNGDVLPCQSYYVSAGNLLADPWDSIWNSDLFLSFRNREQDPRAAGLPEVCRDCPDLSMCGGGCRLEHETHGMQVAERGCGRARGQLKKRE